MSELTWKNMLTCQEKFSPKKSGFKTVRIFDEVRPKMPENSTRIFAEFSSSKIRKIRILFLEATRVTTLKGLPPYPLPPPLSLRPGDELRGGACGPAEPVRPTRAPL